MKVRGEMFKRYASKQNTKLEESQKGMLDKLGDEAAENLNQEQVSSFLIEFLKKGADWLFFFVS